MFTSEHPPSVWGVACEQLGDNYDVDELTEEHGGIHGPFGSTTSRPRRSRPTARARLWTLREAAGINPDEGDYLTPHGARRGMIGEVFKHDRGEAQDLGRHREMATTEEAYRHLDVEKQRKRVDDVLDEINK